MPERRLHLFFKRFLKHLEARGHTPRTLETYSWILGRFRRFLDEQDLETLEEVNPQVLAEYQTKILIKGRLDGGPLTGGSQSLLIGRLGLFFRYLVKQGHLLVNPAENLVVPRASRPPPRRVLTVHQVKRLLLVPDVTDLLGLRDRAILEVLYSTGIRVSELKDLDTADISLTEGELRIRRGKGRRGRLIPVGEAACLWVGRYLEASRPELLVKRSQRALFLSRWGKRLERSCLTRIVRTYAKEAKIPFRVTPHVVRHTFATHLLKGKASIRHVQEMLGHTTLTSTQIYTRLEISDLKATHRACHPRGQR